jgi:thymidylate synthase ThyX
MEYAASILADSISLHGHRLTTLEITFPRIVLPEFNTHRVFSRNSASSRAIPVVKQLQRVLDEPYVPFEWGTNKRGMQAGAALRGQKAKLARKHWLDARDSAVAHVIGLIAHPDFCWKQRGRPLGDQISALREAIDGGEVPSTWLNVHKQLANRLLEPFMWHTVIVTATEWDNFWHLRTHRDAQPEIRRIAVMMRNEWDCSRPLTCGNDEWHLPLTNDLRPGAPDGASLEDAIKICVGRCARVSYLTHSGHRDPSADVALHDRLLSSGHLSPFEHAARPLSADELEVSGEWSANSRGWISYRKTIPNEADFMATKSLATPANLSAVA